MTTFVRRVFPLLALGLVMAAIVRNLRQPAAGGDTWFHLRMGAEFRDGWNVADPGNLSPFDTADWVPTQWLAQLGMVWLEDVAGPGALLWVTGVLALTLLTVVYLTCRTLAAPLPAALATAACFIATAPGLSPRPQVISYVLVAVATAAWLATVRDGKPRWWLVALSWIWAPLHGMWPTGILLGVAVVVGLALGRGLPRPVLLRLAAIPVLSAVVVLLTPTGVGVYSSLTAVSTRSRYFDEWASPDFRSPETMAVAAMVAVVVLVGLTRHRLPPAHVAVLGLAACWALYSSRTGPVAAIMVAPLVAAALQQLLPRSTPATRSEGVAVVAMALAGCLALAVVAPARGETLVAPRWLEARLDELPAGTRVLNDWDIGAWFLWRHPDLSLVSHGYGEVFTEGELERNAGIMRVQPGWRAAVARLDVDYALVRPGTSLAYALDGEGWAEVEGDDDFLLLTPPAAS